MRKSSWIISPGIGGKKMVENNMSCHHLVMFLKKFANSYRDTQSSVPCRVGWTRLKALQESLSIQLPKAPFDARQWPQLLDPGLEATWSKQKKTKATKLQQHRYLAIPCDLFGMVKWPFKGLSDLKRGMVTLNHLVYGDLGYLKDWYSEGKVHRTDQDSIE